jgi:hypothetical protein
MKISEAFPSKYLKADDLDGEDVTATITKITREEVGEEKQLCLILYFKEDLKPMVCNKTNAKRIELYHGNETDDWMNKKIVLQTEWVTFKGDSIEALRVKPPGKTTKRKHVIEDRGNYTLSTTEPAEEGLNDEIPFDPPAAKPNGMSFEQMAKNAASHGYEQLNALYKAPSTTLEQKRWLALHKLELEQLYPNRSS